MKPCVLSFGALAVTFVTLRWFTVKVDAGLAEANLVNNEVKVIRTGPALVRRADCVPNPKWASYDRKDATILDVSDLTDLWWELLACRRAIESRGFTLDMVEKVHEDSMGINLSESLVPLQLKEDSWPMPAVYCFKTTQVFRPVRWSTLLESYEDPNDLAKEAWVQCLKSFRTKTFPFKFDKTRLDAVKAKHQEELELRRQLNAAEAAEKERIEQLKREGKVCKPVLTEDDIASYDILNEYQGRQWAYTIPAGLKLSDQLAYCQSKGLLVEWDKSDLWPSIARQCWSKYRLRKRDRVLHPVSWLFNREVLRLKYSRLNWLLCLDGTYRSKDRKDPTIEAFLKVIKSYGEMQKADNIKVSFIEKGEMESPTIHKLKQSLRLLAMPSIPEDEEEVKNQNSRNPSVESDNEEES